MLYLEPKDTPFPAFRPQKVLLLEESRLEELPQAWHAQVLASVHSRAERTTKIVLGNRLRQEDGELEASLGYVVRLYIKQNKTKGKTISSSSGSLGRICLTFLLFHVCAFVCICVCMYVVMQVGVCMHVGCVSKWRSEVDVWFHLCHSSVLGGLYIKPRAHRYG